MAKEFDLRSANYTEMQHTPGSALVAGEFVTISDVSAFALTDIAASALGTVITAAEKVACPMAAVTVVEGEIAYWDATAGKITNVSTANTQVGYFARGYASGTAEALIVFDGNILN